MDSFDEAPRFTYNPNPNPESDDTFSGILEIHVHHARNIHNICIYDDQDVYAKFSLTYNPDETISTRIINGGGKNPDFNEDLIMKISQSDAVLKCEIWMLSRVKNYMDDQLLGFALVPISSVFGKGKVTQDYSLSSTDLFHSPAGTIKLSLSLDAKTPIKHTPVSFTDSVSQTSELLMDKRIPEEYCRVEFPDMELVNGNQILVSEFFAKNRSLLLSPWLERPDGSFLHLGSAPYVPVEDYEMAGNSYPPESISPDGSIQTSCFMSSTMTSMSDDRNSADSLEKKGHFFCDFSKDNVSAVSESPTLEKKTEPPDGKESHFLGKEEGCGSKNYEGSNMNSVNVMRNVEESAMQQQIVDMYMRSMQQFTESLAKMKLPMDLDKPQADDDQGDVIQDSDKKTEIEQKKKDNSRVFYGSRAFF